VAKPGRYDVRVALALGDTILEDVFVGYEGGSITIGQAEGNTFVLPGRATAGKRGKHTLVKKLDLHLLEGIAGRMHIRGEAQTLDQLRETGQKKIRLNPEDWGVLYVEDEPRIRLVVQCVRRERVGPMPSQTLRDPIWGVILICALAFGGFKFAADLMYAANRGDIDVPDASDRMSRVMFNKPPPEEEEEEPETGPDDQEEEKEAKRAGGEEGKFGDPNKRGPSNVPKMDNARSRTADLAMVGALNDAKDSDVMRDLLGTTGQISDAVGGMDEGALVIGGGNYGMSTKGGGAGGGGEGVGVIGGTGDVDTGGAGSSNRKKTVKGAGKPKEKKVAVRTGTPTVKGQLSKALIDKEVRRHRAQIRFCYEKQLNRFPKLAGKVTLSWVISMDGSVKKPRVKSSSLKNKDVESCMIRSLGGWRFPKPQGGVVAVDYPFMFGSQ
jgi:hypothetical protein